MPKKGRIAVRTNFWHAQSMKLLRVMIILVGSGLLLGCETLDALDPWRAEGGGKIYRGTTFELRHPPSVTTATSHGDEYVVHYFRVGQSKCMLGVYEGERPKLFKKNERDLTVMRHGSTARNNIKQGDDIWGVDSKGGIWRESLWSCQQIVQGADGKTAPIPILLHLWYFGATDEEQGIFDSIVDTLEVK